MSHCYWIYDERSGEIFRVMSPRLLSKYPEREKDLLDEIIENLNKYLELTTMSKGWKIIAYNGFGLDAGGAYAQSIFSHVRPNQCYL